MSNLVSPKPHGKVLTTGIIHRRSSECTDCGEQPQSCTCEKLDGYDLKLMRSDRDHDEARGK